MGNIAPLDEELNYGSIMAKVGKAVNLLSKEGITLGDWQKLIDDREFRSRLCHFLQADGDIFKPYFLARLVLGDDLITPEEIVQKRFPFHYTRNQFIRFQQALASLSLIDLKWLVDQNYVLIAGPSEPKDLISVHDLDDSLFLYEDLIYKDPHEMFGRNEFVRPVWYALRKNGVKNSGTIPYLEKCKLLLPEEEIPTAVEVAWIDSTYLKLRGDCLHEHVVVQTSSLSFSGKRIAVGFYPHTRDMSNRVFVRSCKDDDSNFMIGLAACRVIPTPPVSGYIQ